MEIITGVERRRRWRVEDKLRIVAEMDQPGASVADIARRYDISRGLLWNWRSKVRLGTLTRRLPAGFLPVQLTADPRSVPFSAPNAQAASNPTADGLIEITLPDGSRVRVGNDVSLTTLRRVMTVLRG